MSAPENERTPGEAAADPMLRIAEAIADDRPVDWETQLAETPEQTSRLMQFRVVETVAALHREAGAEASAATGARDGARNPMLFAWGHLRAIAKLGEGAFGEVYRAWDPALQREVALKLRRATETAADSSARRWLDEARRLARVRHPNVLVVHGADVHDGRAGIWTDLIQGQSLEERLASQGRLSADEAALIGLDLCRALAAVHAAGLVHGDVKASNVMREGAPGGAGAAPSGRIVLMDFGAAHDRLESSPALSTSFGTPLSTAPEVLNDQPATPASDLYSLAVLLHRLVTGRYPVEATTLEELRTRLPQGAGTALRELRPDLPTAFVQVVRRALAVAPADRFRDAGEMESALAASFGGSAAAQTPPPGTRAVPLMVGAGALAVIVVAAFLFLRPDTEPSKPAGDGALRVVPPAGPIEPGAVAGPVAGAPAPTSSTSPAPPPVSAPAALSVQATMLRTTHGSHEPLRDGELIALGDQLALELESTEPVYAYVLNEDDQGHLYALFPVAGVDLANPLAGGRHRLPGSKTGKNLDWQVTSVGGRERFLIVASRRPLAELEHQIAAVVPAKAGEPVRYPELDPAALGSLRGLGGLVASEQPLPPGGGRLAALARGTRRATSSDAIWIRFLELENGQR